VTEKIVVNVQAKTKIAFCFAVEIFETRCDKLFGKILFLYTPVILYVGSRGRYNKGKSVCPLFFLSFFLLCPLQSPLPLCSWRKSLTVMEMPTFYPLFHIQHFYNLSSIYPNIPVRRCVTAHKLWTLTYRFNGWRFCGTCTFVGSILLNWNVKEIAGSATKYSLEVWVESYWACFLSEHSASIWRSFHLLNY
jgi:hypothetical protein